MSEGHELAIEHQLQRANAEIARLRDELVVEFNRAWDAEARLAAVQVLLDDPAHTAFVGVAALRRAVAGGR